MQNFDLLDFLRHNYISLGNLVNQNMWRSYCYADPNIWWWHLQEETEMPFGNIIYYFTENNRYRVSLTLVFKSGSPPGAAYYLYIEDLNLAKVHVYVSAFIISQNTSSWTGGLNSSNTVPTDTPNNDNNDNNNISQNINIPNNMFQNLNIEILDDNGDSIHSYTWDADMVILRGKQLFFPFIEYNSPIANTLLIFDKNAALLYLYNSSKTRELILYFLAFSEQSNSIVGKEYNISEVTNITNAANPPSSNLASGLNNTHIYIHNMTGSINTIRIYINNNNITYHNFQKFDGSLVRPLGTDLSWIILFFFRPTPVSCSDPTNCSLLLPVNQHFTGRHVPVTIWKLTDGLHLSINCGNEKTYLFILFAHIKSSNNQFFLESYGDPTQLAVSSNYNLTPPLGRIYLYNDAVMYEKHYVATTMTLNSCDIQFNSLFHYHGNNTEPLIWLFHYDSSDNNAKSYVIYTENMDYYNDFITDDYIISNWWMFGIYDQMIVASQTTFSLASYLTTSAYHTHLTQFFIFNTLAYTAPQVVNGNWNYMHYLRFVLDDYTSSNLRIPLAIIDGAVKRNNIIKYHEISIDKMSTSQRYPIVQLDSLSKAQMPDVVLDGYIASLNDDAGKKEDSSFGTLMPYYDLKEAKIQEPHPEWYFRIHIHAGTWYYIFNNIMYDNNNQMKTYRIQHNDGSLRIVLDVGLYFEIITETANTNNKKYTIVYADIFPSVYWCYGNKAYEFLNVNVEWVQCRYSIPGSSMVRARPNNNIITIGRPEIF